MGPELLVCVGAARRRFVYEDYTPEEDILALACSGRFTVRSDGGEDTVCAGEAAYFRAGVRYFRRVEEPVKLYLFRFRWDRPAWPRTHVVFRDTQRIASTLSLLERLDRLMFREDFSYRKALFQDILTQMAIESGEEQQRQGIPDPVIAAAADHMKQNLHKKLSPEDSARRSGLSYVQFLRRFKQAVGMTPTEFLSEIRMQKARILLSDTELPIRAVARECGFENEYYFSNCFKKYHRLAPSLYREQVLKNTAE